jgi:hypothetical protein
MLWWHHPNPRTLKKKSNWMLVKKNKIKKFGRYIRHIPWNSVQVFWTDRGPKKSKNEMLVSFVKKNKNKKELKKRTSPSPGVHFTSRGRFYKKKNFTPLPFVSKGFFTRKKNSRRTLRNVLKRNKWKSTKKNTHLSSISSLGAFLQKKK